MSRVTVRRRTRRGFTITELIVTIGILAVVGSVAGRLLLGQQRFFQRTTEQLGQRRELRMALSQVPTDLRSVSSVGGDIAAFSASGLTVRSVLGVGLVCARPDPNTVDVPPPDQVTNRLSGWYATPQIGDTLWAFNDSLSRGAEDDVWTPMRITSVSASTAYCAGSPYTHATLDAPFARYRFGVSPALPDSVVVGSAIRFTRSVRYDLQQQASGRYYLTRAEHLGGAWQAAAAVSGPYEAPSNSGGGVRFAYFDSLGAAVGAAASSRSIARIDLLLRTRGADASGNLGASGTATRDSLAFRIALRNRQ